MDDRISISNTLLRGLDTYLHKDATQVQGLQGESFSGILSGVMGSAQETDAAAHANVDSMVVGDYDVDSIMVGSTKAELAISLMVTVRDKAVEAYNEIMRMQV